MDLKDIYHELSYDVPGVSGPKEHSGFLEDWVTRSPIFSLGPHTEKQLKGWKSVRNVLRTLSKEERGSLKDWANKYIANAAYCLENKINVGSPLNS